MANCQPSGVLLCDRKNEAVVELTLPEDANIYASKYQLYLPSREELADQVARVRAGDSVLPCMSATMSAAAEAE